MKHTRGVWFAPESGPDESTVGHLIRGAVQALPDWTHGTVTTRLPNGTVLTQEGRISTTASRLTLTLTPALSGDDEMVGWPQRIPWDSVLSVEVS
jgi:hypothetical protein